MVNKMAQGTGLKKYHKEYAGTMQFALMQKCKKRNNLINKELLNAK